MRVYVTQMDIDEGERLDPRNCPVARALRRQTGDLYSISQGFGVRRCRVGDPTHGLLPLPPEIGQFARDFDMERPVAPFWFDIPLEVEQPAQPIEAAADDMARMQDAR